MALPPLELADGTRIDPTSGEVIKDPSAKKAKKEPVLPPALELPANLSLVGTYKATDLPDSPRVMAVVSAVLSLELWGLPPTEIAKVLKTEEQQVHDIQAGETYVAFKSQVMNNLMRALEGDVRGIIALNAKAAAGKLVETLHGQNKKDIRFRAANAILDRGGFGPKSVVDHRVTMEDELVIRVIQDKGEKQLPTIDLSADNA